MTEKIITAKQITRSTLNRLIAEAQEDITECGYGGNLAQIADSASFRVIARIGLRMIKEQQDRNKLLEKIAAAAEKGFWS